MKTRYRNTGPTPAVVEAVYERAAWACEICTGMVGPVRGKDHHLHHRRPRQMGGSKRRDTNLPSNLLLLCPDCHATTESHRAEAYAVGWLLRQNDRPAEIAVLVQRDRWCYLGEDGRYHDDPPGERS